MNHSTIERLLVSSALLLVLVALACYSGYFQARSLPIRFPGEKLLISLLCGGSWVLVFYGLVNLQGGTVEPLRLAMLVGFFLLQGVSAEVTVHVMAKRARKD